MREEERKKLFNLLWWMTLAVGTTAVLSMIAMIVAVWYVLTHTGPH